MGTFVALAKAMFGKLSLCALVGGLVGAITGFFFSLFQLQNPGLVLTVLQVLAMGIELGLLGWLFVLLVVGVWLHYGAGSIAFQALVNALLTSILVVFFNNLLQLPAVAVPIGMLIGILVGYLLCILCGRYDQENLRKHHG